tara:strand:+ start:5128 stop:6141 length:1014 start_codon:yes stop_codon:yes gene_type:complete
MSWRRLVAALQITFLCAFSSATIVAQSEPSPLTESQIQAIKKQLEELKTAARTKTLSKNSSAEQVFRSASGSPKAALELYLRCHQEINFTRMNKSDSDFREWRNANEEQHEFEPFLTALQLQLEYLALATRSAQTEEISTVFTPLTSFMAKLSTLSEPPHPELNRNIASTIFAEVYELDEALARNAERWEGNPLNIGGVYEKTILPYLREKMPASLDNAWSSRIKQEVAMAKLFIEFEDKMERYQERNEGEAGAVRRQIGQMAGFVRGRAKAALQFEKERLPELKWAQARDQYEFGNRALAAKSMLDIIQANIGHDEAEGWISELEGIVGGSNTAES